MTEEIEIKMRKAIKSNNLESVKEIFEKNPDCKNAITVFGSFLHDAAKYGKYEIVKYFINNGFNVNLKAGFLEANALTDAVEHGYLDIVELLHNAGAIFDTSTFSANPLFAAIYNRHVEIAKYLIDMGIDTTVTYHIGEIENCDAMEYVKQYGCIEIYNYLKAKSEK